MSYEFVTGRQDYSDLASGQVLYSHPGFPALPVRLVSEIFERCLSIRKAGGREGPCRVFDPCCGSAYHLTALAFLYGGQISHITASDIDRVSCQFADQNLGLLTLPGLDNRITELTHLLDLYHKESHAEAIQSAKRLRAKLETYSLHGENPWISTAVFSANALSGELSSHLDDRELDLLITDIPYGLHSDWQGLPALANEISPIQCLLENLLPWVSIQSVLAICADKGQKISHDAYQKVDHFQVGKRRIALLKKR
jgi:hypothetical protein